MIFSFKIETKTHTDFIDITPKIRDLLSSSSFKEGLCHIFIPHTTAGVTINENADPDVKTDIIRSLEKIFPWNAGYMHTEGNSAAHIKASLMGFSVQIPVENGRLLLGTWQCVYFCEFDGPRTRNIVVSFIGN